MIEIDGFLIRVVYRMSEQLHIQISELMGSMPDVSLADGVDYAALVAGDDDPVFLTLPLLETGAVSRNGKRYDADAVRALVEQINKNKPGGILGHMSDGERSTRFDLPSLMWVGATLDQDGKAWGKAYIPKYAANVREYVLKSKARRANIATSIYGTATMDGNAVKNLRIESIDLADPTRAGVGAAVAEPIITREQIDIEEGDMPENDALISELRGDRDRIREQYESAQTRISEMETRIAELEQHEETVTALRGLVPQGELVDAVREMTTVVREAARQQRESAIAEAVNGAMGDIAKNQAGAALIREMVGPVESAEAATARVGELLQQEHVKAMLKAVVNQPAVIVGEQGGGNWTDEIVANADKSAAKFGLNV